MDTASFQHLDAATDETLQIGKSHCVILMGSRERCNAIRPVQDAADTIGLPLTMFYHPDYGWNGIGSLSAKWSDRKFVRQVRATPGAVTWLPVNYFPTP